MPLEQNTDTSIQSSFQCLPPVKKLRKENFVFDSVMRFMTKLFRFEPIFLDHIHKETISTRNSIVIINRLSLNTSIFHKSH